MKRIFLVFFAVFAFSTLASPTAEVTVRQRWPFSEKIDVDFTVSASDTCPCRVELISSYEDFASKSEPIVICTNTYESIVAGDYHFVLDPADYGLSGRELRGFKVTAIVNSLRYLIFDLDNKTVAYADAEPETTWTNRVYLNQYMVFRRVKAGTYNLGYESNQVHAVKNGKPSVNEMKYFGKRSVTLTHDYYLGVFPVSGNQAAKVASSGSGYAGYTAPYTFWRGGTNADESLNVNWPSTDMSRVATSSFIYKLRAKFGDTYRFDLPSVAQMEVAMRAGTQTIFPNGGDANSTQDELKALWAIYSPKSGEDLGLRAANPWGFYNCCGISFHWCLEPVDIPTPQSWGGANPASAEGGYYLLGSGTDPFGTPYDTASGKNLAHLATGSGWNTGTGLPALFNYARAYITKDNVKLAARIAIHLVDPSK